VVSFSLRKKRKRKKKKEKKNYSSLRRFNNSSVFVELIRCTLGNQCQVKTAFVDVPLLVDMAALEDITAILARNVRN